MKATNTLLSTIIIGVTLIIMTGCSQGEDLIDAGTQALNAATNNDKELVLTASEQIALSVKQKGSYDISEKEAKKNFESYAKTIHKEKAVKVKALSLKKNKKNGRNLYYEVIFENDKGTGFSLLSADERVDKLLCYSENGSISDTSFNKSLKYCLELVDLYVEGQTQKELDIESLASSANQKIKAANKGKVITKALPPFDPDDPNSPWSYDRTDVKNEVTAIASSRLYAKSLYGLCYGSRLANHGISPKALQQLYHGGDVAYDDREFRHLRRAKAPYA